MKKSMFIILIVTAFLTFVVIMIELSIRSAVLSPFILIESQKNVETQKLLTGYSIYHGDYLLNIKDTEDVIVHPLAFHIGNTEYQFTKVDNKNIVLDAGKKELIVITRRGIEPFFNKEVMFHSSKANLFFNEYTIRIEENVSSFSIQLKSKFNKTFTLLIYCCSWLLPFLIALFINKVLPWHNLFTLFMPFILAGVLPIILNYQFTLDYSLLLTKSFILSILISIFLPTFLSISLTTALYQWLLESDTTNKQITGSKESDFLVFSRREIIVILLLVIGSLTYFFSFFLLPLSIYVKIVEEWCIFAVWYLSLTLIITLVINLIHRFMGEYNNVGNSEKFPSLKKSIESACNLNINLFTKNGTSDETNAWVYSIPLLTRKSINIYLTEGLIKKFTLDEIKAVLFHEIGHIKLKHGRWIILITFGVATIISLIMFFIRKMMLGFGWGYYIFIYPVGGVILIVLTELLPNKIRKLFEHHADEFAVRKLGNKKLYIQTLMKLEELSRDEFDEFEVKKREWKETHPSTQKRINFIKDLR